METTNFSDKKRIVLKVGTESITKYGFLDESRIKKVVDDIIYIREYNGKDKRITLVSSGAIAKGRQMTKDFNIKDENVIKKQYLASIGQPDLIHAWNNELMQRGYFGSQILVDKSNFDNNEEFRNLENIYNYTLEQKCIPIFNENDPLAIEEICFGDNDILASYVTTRLKNDLLVIFTTKDGLMKDNKVVPYASEYDKNAYDFLEDSECGRGGIKSKLQAAKMCNENSIPCIISNIEYKLYDILKGDAPRTVFNCY